MVIGFGFRIVDFVGAVAVAIIVEQLNKIPAVINAGSETVAAVVNGDRACVVGAIGFTVTQT